MQNKNNQQKKKKKVLKPVYKPYYKGNPMSKSLLKRSGKIFAVYLVFIFLYLVLGTTMNFENIVLRVVTNGALLLATIGILYMEGSHTGDADVAFAEIIQIRADEGKNVDQSDKDRCFHPLKGVYAGLLGVLPVFLITLIYAIMAKPQAYSLQGLPGWVNGFSQVEEIALPLQYYQQEISFTFVDIIRIITRLLIYPYVNIVTVENADGLLLLDRISFLLVLIPAAGYMFGYSRGPYSRALTHGNIAVNNRRSARKRKKEIRARQNKNKEII